jgi:hypothetical protein
MVPRVIAIVRVGWKDERALVTHRSDHFTQNGRCSGHRPEFPDPGLAGGLQHDSSYRRVRHDKSAGGRASTRQCVTELINVCSLRWLRLSLRGACPQALQR